LRALVAEGFVDGHTAPLSTLSRTIETASGERGLNERLAGLKTYLVALFANGLGPLRLLRSWWSGAQPDELRNGPLDKRGCGSRILDATAQIDEAELARLAEFGRDRPDPSGGVERGLRAQEIATYMDANFERAKATRRWIDRLLMNGEWPVLLNIMGKGEGKERYLSVAEVRTLFVERRLPERIAARLPAPAPGRLGMFVQAALGAAVLAIVAFFLAIIELPDQVGKFVPPLAQILPPPLPDRAPVKSAVWLDQNWSTEDRHWFHHASQGTATFQVPYDWFMALEQPGLHLVTQPGLLSDTAYLERFGFLPSPKSVHTDPASLRRFGYLGTSNAPPAPESVGGLRPTAVENFDGLPVGFARLSGVTDPGTGLPVSDQIGLTCAACHTGSIRYKGTSIRFDGGPAMVDLKKLELATGLSVAYTLKVPGRFGRFAMRVLGPDATPEEYNKLKADLTALGARLLSQKNALDKAVADQRQANTEEGFGRLDALNRIGNQVFATDLAISGLSGFEKNLHAQDAPVSFPPIWTVPWFRFAQYDASIEQPLIRNAGEALGVFALVNLSPDYAAENLFRSSMALENLVRIEAMLRGPDLTGPSFGGLQPPKWPSQIFANDEAWKINPARVSRGRGIYAEICAECHLGPVSDPAFDTQYPEKSFWSSPQWDAKAQVLDPVQKSAAGMGTDPAQANVLLSRMVDVPGFLKMDPAQDLGKNWGCQDLPTYLSTEIPFSIALMIAVDRSSRKWMDDHNVPESSRPALWEAPRKNCPNPVISKVPHYRARPLNGVWATAPYLHNGSVPSLYWLLKPAAERPKQFCLGSRDFDPQQVGFRVNANAAPSCNKGETLFSSTTSDGSAINGNSVLGHSLEGAPGPDKPGVIGRLLTDEERFDLLEYLKTL
jgi:mono/diheme cytochrome c family protein